MSARIPCTQGDLFGQRFAAAVLLFILSPLGFADQACLLTPAELQAATGRAFNEGQATRVVGDGSPLCVYAETGQPQRKLTIGVSTQSARRQFESRMRLLRMGNKPIELAGVGDAAYFNGTAAGVLAGDRFISLSGLRRGASKDEQIAPERVVGLLQAALKRIAH